MDSPSLHHLTYQHDAECGKPAGGFSLLEMMMVVTLILIVVSIATPIFQTVVVRTREAVLADHLREAISSQPSAFSELADN
jgi:prepilin-type N-terminal cleavage/methylation domain-containing protein